MKKSKSTEAQVVHALKDAETHGLVVLEYDQARGNHKIRLEV